MIKTGNLQHTRFARCVKELVWTPCRSVAFGPLKLYHRRRGWTVGAGHGTGDSRAMGRGTAMRFFGIVTLTRIGIKHLFAAPVTATAPMTLG